MNKMLLAAGLLAVVTFNNESDGTECKWNYDTENRVLRCYNMKPDDFKKCEADLYNACEVEFTNCTFSPIVCDNVGKLTFTGCPQIQYRKDALYYVRPWYCDDPDVINNGEKL